MCYTTSMHLTTKRLFARELKIKQRLGCTPTMAAKVGVMLDERTQEVYDDCKQKSPEMLLKQKLYMRAAAAEIYTMIGLLSFPESRFGVGAEGVKFLILEQIKRYEHGHE